MCGCQTVSLACLWCAPATLPSTLARPARLLLGAGPSLLSLAVDCCYTGSDCPPRYAARVGTNRDSKADASSFLSSARLAFALDSLCTGDTADSKAFRCSCAWVCCRSLFLPSKWILSFACLDCTNHGYEHRVVCQRVCGMRWGDRGVKGR